MNKERRKEINALAAKLEELAGLLTDIKDSVESIRDEEQEYFDNMPESLQGGDRGMVAEEAASNLEQAMDALEDIDLDSIVSYLEEAAQ